jgi:hypothetical protein
MSRKRSVHDDVAKYWTFRDGVPLPRMYPACPVCRHNLPALSRVRFHERKDSPSRYRCDVGFKCRTCSHYWVHGVVVPRSSWKQHANKAYSRHDLARKGILP